MKNILAFAGSNSKTSINKQLAISASKQLKDVTTTVLDLNDFELPMYSIDLEQESGIPATAQAFLEHINKTDGIILSLAEHNGAYASVFKNLMDWMSRIDGKLWADKPMLLMATSPGGRGGASVLEIAKARFPYMGGNIVSEFSLPSFGQNFENGEISDSALSKKLEEATEELAKAL